MPAWQWAVRYNPESSRKQIRESPKYNGVVSVYPQSFDWDHDRGQQWCVRISLRQIFKPVRPGYCWTKRHCRKHQVEAPRRFGDLAWVCELDEERWVTFWWQRCSLFGDGSFSYRLDTRTGLWSQSERRSQGSVRLCTCFLLSKVSSLYLPFYSLLLFYWYVMPLSCELTCFRRSTKAWRGLGCKSNSRGSLPWSWRILLWNLFCWCWTQTKI